MKTQKVTTTAPIQPVTDSRNLPLGAASWELLERGRVAEGRDVVLAQRRMPVAHFGCLRRGFATMATISAISSSTT